MATASSRPGTGLTPGCVQVLMTATGRFANTAGLGLERVGVETDEDGWVVVNSNLQTSNPSIYAAGDVVGAPGLASTGIEQVGAALTGLWAHTHNSMAAPPVRRLELNPRGAACRSPRGSAPAWQLTRAWRAGTGQRCGAAHSRQIGVGLRHVVNLRQSRLRCRPPAPRGPPDSAPATPRAREPGRAACAGNLVRACVHVHRYTRACTRARVGCVGAHGGVRRIRAQTCVREGGGVGSGGWRGGRGRRVRPQVAAVGPAQVPRVHLDHPRDGLHRFCPAHLHMSPARAPRRHHASRWSAARAMCPPTSRVSPARKHDTAAT